MVVRDLAAALEEAARTMHVPRDYLETLQTVVDVARDSLPGIDHASITVAHRDGGVETVAATDDAARRLDRLQYELREGPCLHAADAARVVRVDHVPDDDRWPRFLRGAAELGLRSQLGVQLHLDPRSLGALNLYSVSAAVVDEEAQQLAELLSTHASVALSHARQVQGLQHALESRTTISIALGILMERLGIDRDAAFAYLTRVSATTETKLRDVAATLVEQHEQGDGG